MKSAPSGSPPGPRPKGEREAQTRTVRAERAAHGGAVIAHEEGGALMVFYALPGELVEIVAKGRRGGLTYANTVRVLEPSADRVTSVPDPGQL